MKIRWITLYYPAGYWEDESRKRVKIKKSNFRAKLAGGDKIICITKATYFKGGHGDPGGVTTEPAYYWEDTLEPLIDKNVWIEVDAEILDG